MTPKQGLLLQDEKILTAKRLAFRNLWRLDRDLFVRDDHSEMKDVHQVCLQQVSIISVMQQTKENSVSLAEFLNGLPGYFERVLRNSFPPEKQAKLDMFLAQLGQEANQCVSIIDDCNCWLARLREHGADYLKGMSMLPYRFRPHLFVLRWTTDPCWTRREVKPLSKVTGQKGL